RKPFHAENKRHAVAEQSLCVHGLEPLFQMCGDDHHGSKALRSETVAATKGEWQSWVEPPCIGFLLAAIETRDHQGLTRHKRHLLNRTVAIDGDLLELQRVAAVAEGDGLERLRQRVVVGEREQNLAVVLGVGQQSNQCADCFPPLTYGNGGQGQITASALRGSFYFVYI